MAFFKNEIYPDLRVDGVVKFTDGLAEVKGAKQIARLRRLGHLGVVEVKKPQPTPDSVPVTVTEQVTVTQSPVGPPVEPPVEPTVAPVQEQAHEGESAPARKSRTA